ncbi:hypothetical protein GC090_23120 (plasmid) [Pantoea sp. JZ29]|nr:hypothetical protein GC090_23120 [Pantoea sp. JZ29]
MLFISINIHQGRAFNNTFFSLPQFKSKRSFTPGVRAAVMLRTEPARRLCPGPAPFRFRSSGFPS